MTRYIFQVTQPPGKMPPMAGGQCDDLGRAIREGGHYHRMYAQDARARLEVFQVNDNGDRELILMATEGKP